MVVGDTLLIYDLSNLFFHSAPNHPADGVLLALYFPFSQFFLAFVLVDFGFEGQLLYAFLVFDIIWGFIAQFLY